MLRDIDITKIPFELNGKKKYLRFNMNSRLYLEYMCEDPDFLKKDTKLWTFDDMLHLLRAMLMDAYYSDNKEFIEKRDFMNVKPTLSELGRYLDDYGQENLMKTLISGIVAFFPESPVGAKPPVNPPRAM